jgi:hypothetical protein
VVADFQLFDSGIPQTVGTLVSGCRTERDDREHAGRSGSEEKLRHHTYLRCPPAVFNPTRKVDDGLRLRPKAQLASTVLVPAFVLASGPTIVPAAVRVLHLVAGLVMDKNRTLGSSKLQMIGADQRARSRARCTADRNREQSGNPELLSHNVLRQRAPLTGA